MKKGVGFIRFLRKFLPFIFLMDLLLNQEDKYKYNKKISTVKAIRETSANIVNETISSKVKGLVSSR